MKHSESSLRRIFSVVSTATAQYSKLRQ